MSEAEQVEQPVDSTTMTSFAADFVVYGNGASAIAKIAFGSCHKNKYADPRVWQTIASENPDAFLWMGDAIYPPVRDIASVDQLEQQYYSMLRNDTIGYAEFVKRGTAIFGTWDDHDYGGNDRGADMPDRDARAAAYWTFLNRTPPDQNRKGLYYSVLWQDTDDSNDHRAVKAIFLDTRWHRKPHCIPSVAGRFPLGAGIACLTRWLSAGLLPKYCSSHEPNDAMLGAEQWEWLEQQIKLTPAPAVLLVISSIQVLTTNPAMESWGHFPAERERLIRLLLAAGQSSAVTLLSGDVHHGEVLDPFPDKGYPGAFLEVTSSGLTHDCSKHIYGAMCQPLLELFHGHRHGSKSNYYVGRNYGTVNIDWEAETVTVRVHDVITGDEVLTTGARSFPTAKKVAWTERDVQSVLPCMDGHLIPVAWTALLALVLAAVLGRTQLVRRRKNV